MFILTEPKRVFEYCCSVKALTIQAICRTCTDGQSRHLFKYTLHLEEAGLPYELVPFDTRKGELNRYTFEAGRHCGMVNDRLATLEWMVSAGGRIYTLANWAVRGWAHITAPDR